MGYSNAVELIGPPGNMQDPQDGSKSRRSSPTSAISQIKPVYLITQVSLGPLSMTPFNGQMADA